MNLPIQSVPVIRNLIGTIKIDQGVNPSGIACSICKAGCALLNSTAKAVCLAACNATVCG